MFISVIIYPYAYYNSGSLSYLYAFILFYPISAQIFKTVKQLYTIIGVCSIIGITCPKFGICIQGILITFMIFVFVNYIRNQDVPIPVDLK